MGEQYWSQLTVNPDPVYTIEVGRKKKDGPTKPPTAACATPAAFVTVNCVTVFTAKTVKMPLFAAVVAPEITIAWFTESP